MKSMVSKFVALFLVGVFAFQPAILVFAQESTASADILPSPTPSDWSEKLSEQASSSAALDLSPFATDTPVPTQMPTSTPLPQTPTLTPSVSSMPSAAIKEPMRLRSLPKLFFRTQEPIQVELEHFDQVAMKITVTGPGDEDPRIYVYKKTQDALTIVTLAPRDSLRPGKYRITVTDEDGISQEQEFYWGVLAINPNKSIYQPADTAKLAIAVLNESGQMVCDAKVTLEIRSPDGSLRVLSTGEGTIWVNPVCHLTELSLEPDYEASYYVETLGHYDLKLTAETENGTFTILDGFDARSDSAFDVERIAPTRIYPPLTYPVAMRIKANTDFDGTITETVPESFTISPLDGVLAYEKVSIDAADQDATGKPINITKPFSGDYPISLYFGETLKDPALKDLYSRFGLSGHDGIDFEMPSGTQILAVDEGEVLLAGSGAYGTTIVIEHAWGRSYYGHLSSVTVAEGDKVLQGQAIGLSGNTGLTTGVHLHFGMKLKNNRADNGFYGKTDPLPYLSGNAAVFDFSVKHISWQVVIKKGQEIELGYKFLAPQYSPQLYLSGPLVFDETKVIDKPQSQEATGSGMAEFVLGGATLEVFREARKWQIAADATGILYPAADVAVGSWTNTAGSGTNIYLDMDEGTDSPNDADYTQSPTNPTNSDYDFSHTASPADVGTVTAITVNFRATRTKTATTTVDVFYCASAGCSPTTQIGTQQTLTSSFALYSVTASSLSLTKTEIDNLRVRFRANGTSGTRVRVSAEQANITYTAAPSGPTLDQLMRHGNWFTSAGVEQSFTF